MQNQNQSKIEQEEQNKIINKLDDEIKKIEDDLSEFYGKTAIDCDDYLAPADSERRKHCAHEWSMFDGQ